MPEVEGQPFTQMPDDDFETRMGVKHATQHEANALRRGLDGKAPAGAQDPRIFFDVILAVSLDHRRMRDSRVHVERYVEHLSPPKDRPKPLVVEEGPVGHPVHHRSFKAEPADRAFEFVGCCLLVGSGRCRKGRKSVGVGAYRLVQAVIGAAVSASSFWSPGMYATTPAGRCRPRPFPSSAV